MSGLFAELRRRNVFRVAAAYAVAGWLLTEVASVVLPVFGAPDWVLKVLIALLVLCFPLVLVFSWVYEVTPEGIKREADIQRGESITPHTGRRLEMITIGLIVLAIAVLVGERVWLEPVSVETTATPEPVRAQIEEVVPPVQRPVVEDDPRTSVAVLPFINMSEDPDNEYFSDGISEELLNMLVKLDALRVPSRTSSFTFKGRNLQISEIARQLNVDHVLEGSVRKAGNQVRITAQLIDADTDAHLWSETYTRTLDDIFAIQDEIARAIVDSLKIALGAEDDLTAGSTRDSEAYNHYLKGRYFWHQRTEKGMELAEAELRLAVGKDPGYADAWAALADIYVLQPEYFWASIDEAIPRANAAIERALSFDPDSARALTARAYKKYLFDYDHSGAEADFVAAITADPNYATAYQWYGEALLAVRRFDKGLEMVEKAVALDPLAQVRPNVVGNALFSMGRFRESIPHYRQSLELMPDFAPALGNLAFTHMLLGEHSEARAYVEQWQRALDLSDEDSAYVFAAFDAFAGTGSVESAVELTLRQGEKLCNASVIPWLLTRLGATAAAMDELERCFEQGDPFSVQIASLPGFEPLHSMPRFQALLRKMNLPLPPYGSEEAERP